MKSTNIYRFEMIHTKYAPSASRKPARVAVNAFIPSHSTTAIAISRRKMLLYNVSTAYIINVRQGKEIVTRTNDGEDNEENRLSM